MIDTTVRLSLAHAQLIAKKFHHRVWHIMRRALKFTDLLIFCYFVRKIRIIISIDLRSTGWSLIEGNQIGIGRNLPKLSGAGV